MTAVKPNLRAHRLILCADDYAIAPGVSRAILRLLQAHRISATSCLVVSPFWPEHGAWLRAYADSADIGLHLALTDMAPLGPMPVLCPARKLPSLGALIRLAMLHQLDRGEIAAEIARQVAAFQSALGRPPAFIDGHQHVQQLPIVRDAIVDLWKNGSLPGSTWLRVGDEPIPAILQRQISVIKSLVIGGFGVRLRRLATAAGIPINDRFAGIYDFSDRVSYSDIFERFIHGSSGRTLVMCHPGEVDEALRDVDPVTTSRENELRFFESAAFTDLLSRHGLVVARFFD